MRLGDICKPDVRLYCKSEWGPVTDRWPALSFSSQKIATDFAATYRPDRDLVVFIGTGDPEKTKAPEHRKRLLSVATVEARAPIRTQDIVSPQAWAEAVKWFGRGRWEWSLPITKAHSFVGFPEAQVLTPKSYSGLGHFESFGRCATVDLDEYGALLDLEIVLIQLNLQPRVQGILHLNADNPLLRQEISRLVERIRGSVIRSEQEKTGYYSERNAPNHSEIFQILNRKWQQQNGRCALCGGSILLGSSNMLLRLSPDRIDSSDKSYSDTNVHLTHRGCNYAKNAASIKEWEEFLQYIRSEGAA